jgi:hypothetical protein
LERKHQRSQRNWIGKSWCNGCLKLTTSESIFQFYNSSWLFLE